ncbi:MAG: RNA methyltransferase [Bacteroidales bacterium]|nr:RNA methyltransferase [Bacteroidales bacterium]
MLSQADIKLINSLKLSKTRRKMGLFLVEGPKMVNELIHYPNFEIQLIAASKKWMDSQPNIQGYSPKEISEKALQKLSNFSTANEVLAVVKMPENQEFKLKKETLYLVLDNIQDPGNLGTIIRTAEWFGINEIVCSNDTVDQYNPKVVQSTMGSLFRVHCYYNDISSFLKEQKLPIYGTLLNGKNIYQEKLNSSGFIVIGNESKGISAAVQSLITHPLYIPSHGQSKAESLNASIASAVVMAEFKRNLN